MRKQTNLLLITSNDLISCIYCKASMSMTVVEEALSVKKSKGIVAIDISRLAGLDAWSCNMHQSLPLI